MDNVLVVVDMQNDLLSRVEKGEREKLTEKISEKVDSYKANGDTVIFTKICQLEGDGLGLDCVLETSGWDIVPQIDSEGCDEVLKTSQSGYPFWNDYTYDDVTFEVVGVFFDQAVIANAIGLKTSFPDAPVIVDMGCCVGTTEEGVDAACVIMRNLSIEVQNG